MDLSLPRLGATDRSALAFSNAFFEHLLPAARECRTCSGSAQALAPDGACCYIGHPVLPEHRAPLRRARPRHRWLGVRSLQRSIADTHGDPEGQQAVVDAASCTRACSTRTSSRAAAATPASASFVMSTEGRLSENFRAAAC